MSRIRSRDTEPERIVRSVLHRLGYRFRLHRRDLPGNPDIVLPRHRTVIFVHGCFWHRHAGCQYAYTPKSRIDFWKNKFRRNMKRDRIVRQEMKQFGMKVIIIWECQAKDLTRLAGRLRRLLDDS